MIAPKSENRGIMIASVFIAVVLWLHIATERTAETMLRLQPRVSGLDESRIVTVQPSGEWLLTVEGTGKSLLRNSPEDLPLILDISALPNGAHEFTPASASRVESATQDHIRVTLVAGLPPQITVPKNNAIRFGAVHQPLSMRLHIEELEREQVPVVPFIEADRFSEVALLTSVVVEPDSVAVHGPRSALEALRSLKTTLIRSQVRGSDLIFESRGGDAKTVSLEQGKGDVRVDLPVGLDLTHLDHRARCESSQVVVRLVLSPITERVFESIPVQFVNRPPGFDVRVDSSRMTLTLAGPADVLQAVAESELEPFVDLRPYRSGGVYSVAAEIPLIERLSFRRARPKAFKITLTPTASSGDPGEDATPEPETGDPEPGGAEGGS